MRIPLFLASASFFGWQLILADIAHSAGEIYRRIPTETSIGECSQGSLLEQFWATEDRHGYTNDLFLGCMKNANQAQWVLLSGTSCYGPPDNPRKCKSRQARSVPSFVADRDFRNIEGRQPAPYSMRYFLIRYGLGKGCAIVSQKYSSGLSGQTTLYAWICENIEFYDGANYETNPRKFKTHQLTTVGPNGLKSAPSISDQPSRKIDLSYDPATHFIMASDLYSYSYVR